MQIALCQQNPICGDIAGNLRIVGNVLRELDGQDVDCAVFSELFLQGYPPRDLLDQSWFIMQSMQAIEDLRLLSRKYSRMGICIGAAVKNSLVPGKGLYNSALFICNGEILLQQNKRLLPTYDVFDEHRWFDAATESSIVEFKGEKLGITICEDAWNHRDMWDKPLYGADPVADVARAGATLLINLSGSPFHCGKEKLRFNIMRTHATLHKLPFVFVNQVGGNDELLFDGNSMVLDAQGNLCAHAGAFVKSTVIVDTKKLDTPLAPPEFDSIAHIHDALIMGVKDYVQKCGFSKVCLGLSGGIDSAVTAALAACALGSENVLGVTMPSRYSSTGSVDDSEVLARNLGIQFKKIPIENMFASFLDTMQPAFAGVNAALAQENMQARIRGNILMAISNAYGSLLLTTGNKSEMAVGYCTLYGDMNGGLAVISDLPKTMVYKVAQYINRDSEVIPRATLEKPPSAELRPDQKDQDTLPAYDTLDAILELLIEKGASQREIVSRGFNADTVAWIARAIRVNEYKRRQAAPGLKVTPKAFGSGRRFPIAARYEM